jgi:pimeloyl-ACP methyl ester carboxylesterase
MLSSGDTVTLSDGRRLGYGAAGPEDGRPVFYFHGTPGSRLEAEVGESVARERGLRIFVLERPGFGLSDRRPGRRVVDWVDDVREFADALGIERFAVYGYSGGGPHALACAARLRERVTAVACVSGVGVPRTPGSFDGMGPNERLLHRLVRLWPPLVGAAYRLARRNAERNPDRFFRDFEKDCSPSDKALLADQATRESLRETVMEALRRDVGGAVDDWVALERRPWGFSPGEVRVPASLVFGDDDRMVPVAQGRDLARRIPHAKVVEVPGEGHLLILTRLAEVVEMLEPRRSETPAVN